MGRKKTLTAVQLEEILAMALAVTDTPLPELVFDDTLLDYDWDLATPTSPAVSGDPVLPGGAKLPACGTHPICIRIPVSTLRAYKAKAARTGASYQTLMIRALRAGSSV